jgi:5-methylcytosine-specific restriction protein A
VLLRDGYQCRVCLRVVSGKAAHVDHIIPKSKGGSDLVDNLQTLCVSCHSKKEGWRAIKPIKQG